MKKIRTSALALTLAGVLAVGAAAAGAARIAADLRPDIRVIINGETQTMLDKNGNTVYPIAYEGTTYLPIRALGEALGHDVVWNSKTQTVTLTAREKEEYPTVTTVDRAESYMTELEQEISALKPGGTYAERARQYAALSGKLDAFREDVYDISQAINEDFRQGKTDYKAYNALAQRIGVVDVRVKDALETLEQKTIANDSGYESVSAQRGAELKALEGTAAEVVKKVGDFTPAGTYAERANQYEMYSAAIGGLRDDLAAFSTVLNDDLRQMRVSYSEYNALAQRVDKADVSLKDALVQLQEKLYGQQAGQGGVEQDLTNLERAVKATEDKIAALTPGKTYTERVKQYSALEKELSQESGQLSSLMSALNEDLRQGRLGYKEYNTLSQRAGALDVRLKDARADLEAKTISKEDAGQKPDTGSATYDAYVSKLADLESRADKQADSVYDYKPARGGHNNKQGWRQLEQKLDELDDELERLDDAIERDYKQGNLTAAQYRALEKTLDRVDDILDGASDWLDDDD